MSPIWTKRHVRSEAEIRRRRAAAAATSSPFSLLLPSGRRVKPRCVLKYTLRAFPSADSLWCEFVEGCSALERGRREIPLGFLLFEKTRCALTSPQIDTWGPDPLWGWGGENFYWFVGAVILDADTQKTWRCLCKLSVIIVCVLVSGLFDEADDVLRGHGCRTLTQNTFKQRSVLQ